MILILPSNWKLTSFQLPSLFKTVEELDVGITVAIETAEVPENYF
jgi:hypothetical protein